MTSNNPLVSIIIPLYNAESYISESIESVLSQTYQNIELLVINDGSTDNSFRIAKEYESDKVIIIDQQNKGASAARNLGLQLSKGEFVKFFDADDLMNPEMIESQVKIAIKNPDSIISGKWGRFYKSDINSFQLCREECWRNLNSITWLKLSWKNALPMTQPGIFLLSRKVIEKAGYWDERLSLNDDMEFFTKNILAAKKVFFCDNAILYYRSGLGNLALSSLKTPKGIHSNFLSIQLSVSYFLSVTNDAESLRLAANIWQGFVYEAYFIDKKLANAAEKTIKLLHGSDYKLPSGKVLRFLSLVLGWKLAKRIHLIFRQH